MDKVISEAQKHLKNYGKELDNLRQRNTDGLKSILAACDDLLDALDKDYPTEKGDE